MKKSASKAAPKKCVCPFCEMEVVSEVLVCGSCSMKLRFCPQCKKAVAREATVCSECGAKLS